MSTFIILWLIGACCMAAIIAGKKGHSAVSFFAGLILGVFGVLLAWWQDDLTKAEPPAARNRITAFSAALLAAAPAAPSSGRSTCNGPRSTRVGGPPRERGGSPGLRFSSGVRVLFGPGRSGRMRRSPLRWWSSSRPCGRAIRRSCRPGHRVGGRSWC